MVKHSIKNLAANTARFYREIDHFVDTRRYRVNDYSGVWQKTLKSIGTKTDLNFELVKEIFENKRFIHKQTDKQV